MATTATALSTIADLERHSGRCELVNGEIITMSPTGFEHGRSSSDIVQILGRWCADRGFTVLTCDPGFIWDEHTVRAPDVAVLTAEQAATAPTRGFLTCAPVLVVEVVSPSDEWSELKAKVRGWLAFGVRQVWIVDPGTRTAEVHALGRPVQEFGENDELRGEPDLPGFACRVGAFFA